MNVEDKTITTACPNCGDEVEYCAGVEKQYFPFCSRRCKLIDLGKWLDEEHRIEGDLKDRMPDEYEDNKDDNGVEP